MEEYYECTLWGERKVLSIRWFVSTLEENSSKISKAVKKKGLQPRKEKLWRK